MLIGSPYELYPKAYYGLLFTTTLSTLSYANLPIFGNPHVSLRILSVGELN